LECTNLAQGGRSSRSFRSEGWWEQCLQAKPEYLLIQFGHNDQPGKGPERESAADGDFRSHLRAYVAEARRAGIKPVLITSLERRRWNERGQIEPSLSDYAEATTAVARELSVPLIDLNRLSIELYNRLGATAVRALEPMSVKGADHTHLNAEGSQVIGELVARELLQLYPSLAMHALRDLANAQPQRAAANSALGGLSVLETDAAISIFCGRQRLLVYNKQSPPVPEGLDPVYARSGFLHPVLTPQGKEVTATFPLDHAHQHGIFAAWVKTTYAGREIDFWNLPGRTGRVLHQRVVATFNQETQTGFEVDLVHQTATAPIVDVLRENWKVIAYPTDGRFYCFDIESHQRALTEAPLVIEKYHYGGMALRGRVEWVQGEKLSDAQGQPLKSEASEFVNNLGSNRQAGNHQPARWVALQGTIAGQPVSISVLSHAQNFRAPQAARLHPTKPYFCYSPCVDGSFVIDQQHPLHLRYRYLVTDAELDPEWIDQQWQQWCGGLAGVP
jgi:lysophospholipase L1-like esterase